MNKGVWSGIARRLYILVCVSVLALMPRSAVYAQETRDVSEPPHLIQTVTEKDIYDGMLELGLLENKVLDEPDSRKAYENTAGCIVSVNMGKAYGSGVVWDMTPERVIIVTNKHVLEYWNKFISYVCFPQGYYLDAQILGISEDHDIGFLSIDVSAFEYSELETLCYVKKDMGAYEKMKSGDEIYCLGTELNKDVNDKTFIPSADTADNFYIGNVGDMERYIDEFGETMIYGLGYARAGMSGGGTFDAKGNFIGMISGGTTNGETASVPLPVIMQEYEKFAEY